MGASWDKVTFGETGLRVSPLGIGSSYGVGASELERAFDRGVNFFFWGLRRRGSFGDGIKTLAKRHRAELVVAIQSYSRSAWLMGPWVDRALGRAGLEYVDVLTLGWWNEPPPRRIVDAALAIQAVGKAKHLFVSCHHRPTFEKLLADPAYAGIMVRYNAAHTGAEREVFPHLAAHPRAVLAFTATRWGSLMNPALTPKGEKTPTGTDCYRFVLSSPHVHASLAGPRNGEELDGAMAALDHGPMNAEEMAWMRRVGAAVRANAPTGSPIDRLDAAASAVKKFFGGGGAAAQPGA